MADELIKHPSLPTWPTPAAKILSEEAARLNLLAEGLKYDKSTYKPLNDTLDCILKEHEKWRESVMNPIKVQEDEINRLVPYKSYGGPVAKPPTFWKLFALFELMAIVIYFIVRLSVKG